MLLRVTLYFAYCGLNRWSVTIDSLLDERPDVEAPRKMMELESRRSFIFNRRLVLNNYLSIGVDAKVALEFHRKRQEFFAKKDNTILGSLKNQLYLSPRSRNQFWYAKFGAKEILDRSCKGLEKQIVLIVGLPILMGKLYRMPDNLFISSVMAKKLICQLLKASLSKTFPGTPSKLRCPKEQTIDLTYYSYLGGTTGLWKADEDQVSILVHF
jgi:hypothetical protein